MSNNVQIRIVLADAHPAFRLGVRCILEAEPDFAIVGESANGIDVLKVVGNFRPDILLLDYAIPERGGLHVLEELSREESPTLSIVVTGGMERDQVTQALQVGARGMIPKTADPSTYPKAIRRVFAGELWVERNVLSEWALANAKAATRYGLTRRELEIVREISQGSSNKQIAAKFHVSEPTVKSHLTNIFEKLGVDSRFELSAFALQHHLLR